ncbi:hypothetical protein EOD41_00450 [Mucilaginibacter limnophilus]|uniref:Universal stress protein n=1 Tax=Mucilaginibacter limnophilus TaxID=1932778 RepID=A0A3S2UNY9_9SPHI|nr:hypothetical protein [Mucilaginibacter limnophilus]RVU02443.1 hypothetical protein EOD41_00450 [Mucilaginibacter limnophilus]
MYKEKSAVIYLTALVLHNSMGTILFIHTGKQSYSVALAAERLAALQGCKLLVAHVGNYLNRRVETTAHRRLALTGSYHEHIEEPKSEPLTSHINADVYVDAELKPVDKLFEFVKQANCELIITSQSETDDSGTVTNIARRLMYRLNCPALLLPNINGCITPPERIVYLTDLRYCQPRIIKFLNSLGGYFGSQLLVAHLSASGLPDIEATFAADKFAALTALCKNDQRPQFCNINKTELNEALDVLVHGLNCGAVAIVNNNHHFDKIQEIKKSIAGLPLMLFPF